MEHTLHPAFKEDAIRYADYYGIPYDTLYGWTKDDCRKKRTGDGEPINDQLRDEETIALRKKLRDKQDTLEIFKTISIRGD